MKTVQNTFIRALVSIIIGVLLIRYREETVRGLTILIGALFLITGLISCITYLTDRKHRDDTVVLDANGRQISGFRPTFPIVGIGSMVLGAMLTLAPTAFTTGLTYIIAAMLILGAVNQFVALAAINRIIRVHVIFWLLPCVVLLIGGVAIVKPEWIAQEPIFILGWALALYGVIECIDAFKLMSVNRKYKQAPTNSTTTDDVETTAEPDESAESVDEPAASMDKPALPTDAEQTNS